ncbi:hypothetical protein ABMA68_16390 [Halobacteriovorax sp. FRX-2]|uniref:hypothetical protein n=2 Tax=Halobacteriovorax TaxID=1652133 RepID=UPI00372394D9
MERGVRYLAMLGDTYAAHMHDPVQSYRTVPDEYVVAQLMECMRAKMEDVLMREMKVRTDYDKLAIRSQVMKPVDVSLFELGEFMSEPRAESIINEYRNDPLLLHEDGIEETIFHV